MIIIIIIITTTITTTVTVTIMITIIGIISHLRKTIAYRIRYNWHLIVSHFKIIFLLS